ncbi:MAG: hypothetical protein IJ446_02910 [Oscillospiraceae bacterium]|nr:hypothetical protein [Oscillospiraceae bacterium]
MKITDIIDRIIRSCSERNQEMYLFGFDFDMLDKLDHTDIHKMYKGIKRLDDNYSEEYVHGCEAALNILRTENYDDVMDIGDGQTVTYRHCGLVINNIPAYSIIDEGLYSCKPLDIEGIHITDDELYDMLIVIGCIMLGFDGYATYNIAFIQYMLRIKRDKKIYDKDCLENLFLIAYSEPPDYVRAVKNIEYGDVNGKFGLKPCGKEILLSSVIEKYSAEEYVSEHIMNKYSLKKEEATAFWCDIINILKCFETI